MSSSRVAVLGAVLIAVAWPGVPVAASSIDCSGQTVCRDLKTHFPLRVLPRFAQNIYASMDATGPIIARHAEAFMPLYVFGVANEAAANAPGWYHVGLTPQHAIGFVRAGDVLEWRVPLLASYAAQMKGRDRVIYFDSLGGIDKVIGGAVGALKPGELLGSPTTAKAANVVASEAVASGGARRAADLLPVIQSVDVEAYGISDGWLVQVALPATPAMGLGSQLCPTKIGCVGGLEPAALVDFLDDPGAHPTRPALAWTADFDLAHRDRKSLTLHVLLTRSQLLDLRRAVTSLQSEFRLARLDVWLDKGPRETSSDNRHPSLGAPADQLKLDPAAHDERRPLSELLPAWLAGLPHRTELADLSRRQLRSLPAAQQGRLEGRLADLAGQARQALASRGVWLSVPQTDSREDDHLIIWPVSQVP